MASAGIAVSGSPPATWVTSPGGVGSSGTSIAGTKAAAFIASDVVFPFTFSEGGLFSSGDTSSGAFLGFRTINSTNYLYFAAGDGSFDAQSSTTDIAVIRVTDFPADNAAHEVAWDFFYPNERLRIRLWVDGALKGIGTATGTNQEPHTGSSDGWYAQITGGSAARTGAVVTSWSGGAGDLTYYEGGSIIEVDTTVPPPPTSVDLNTTGNSSYTLALSDAGGIVEMNNSSANTLVIPANSSVSFEVGTIIGVNQIGAGTTTISAEQGVTLNGVDGGSVELASQYSGASIYKRATDEWVIQGDVT